MSKRCCRCGKIKPLKEFYHHSPHKLGQGYKDGYRYDCKECANGGKENRLRYNSYAKSYYYIRKKKEPWWGSLIDARSRCHDKSRNWYKKGIKCFLTIAELKIIWFRDKAYLLEKPSLDRINNNGHYVFSNCRYIEQRENSRLGSLSKRRGICSNGK